MSKNGAVSRLDPLNCAFFYLLLVVLVSLLVSLLAGCQSPGDGSGRVKSTGAALEASSDSLLDESHLELELQQYERMSQESKRKGYFYSELAECSNDKAKLVIYARVYVAPKGVKILSLKVSGRVLRELYEFSGLVRGIGASEVQKPVPGSMPLQNAKISSFRVNLNGADLVSSGFSDQLKISKIIFNEIVYSRFKRKGNLRIFFEKPKDLGRNLRKTQRPVGREAVTVESGESAEPLKRGSLKDWQFFVGCEFKDRLFHLKQSLGQKPLNDFALHSSEKAQ